PSVWIYALSKSLTARAWFALETLFPKAGKSLASALSTSTLILVPRLASCVASRSISSQFAYHFFTTPCLGLCPHFLANMPDNFDSQFSAILNIFRKGV